MGYRHVWVERRYHAASSDPGLVLDWRRTPEGWEALVTWIDSSTTDERVVTEWVPAARLTPVTWRPGIGSAYG